MVNIDTDEFIRPMDLQRIIKIPVSTLYRWISEGKIPSYKFWGRLLIKKADIENQIKDYFE